MLPPTRQPLTLPASATENPAWSPELAPAKVRLGKAARLPDRGDVDRGRILAQARKSRGGNDVNRTGVDLPVHAGGRRAEDDVGGTVAKDVHPAGDRGAELDASGGANERDEVELREGCRGVEVDRLSAVSVEITIDQVDAAGPDGAAGSRGILGTDQEALPAADVDARDRAQPATD